MPDSFVFLHITIGFVERISGNLLINVKVLSHDDNINQPDDNRKKEVFAQTPLKDKVGFMRD